MTCYSSSGRQQLSPFLEERTEARSQLCPAQKVGGARTEGGAGPALSEEVGLSPPRTCFSFTSKSEQRFIFQMRDLRISRVFGLFLLFIKKIFSIQEKKGGEYFKVNYGLHDNLLSNTSTYITHTHTKIRTLLT